MNNLSIHRWGPRSLSWCLTALVAAGIIFLGARFILTPAAGADGFGISLPPTKSVLAYGWIKGIRDIFSGVVVTLFLLLRNRPATAIAFGAAIIIPVSDCLTVFVVNGPKDTTHILIHGITALYMTNTTILLFKAKP